MKVIITGGSGFVGSHTIKALKEKGYEVFNYDIRNKDGSEKGWDIRNRYLLEEVIEEGDKVLHLAAIARFGEADKDPLLAFETNVLGTQNIAKACEVNGAERMVYSSTGSVYMPIEQEPPITEDFICRGNSVYACCKYLGELMIKKECKTAPYIILRYAHLFGEGKTGHGAVGGFIDRMNRGLLPILYGGKQSNDFTYIKDVVEANIRALECDKECFNQAYNIGTSEELTTIQVFEILKEIFGYNTEFERLPARSVDPLRFVFDVSKAERELGFKAKFNFREGMADWLNDIKLGNKVEDKREGHEI